MDQNERLNRGYNKLQEIDGKAGMQVKDSLNDICPDLVKYMIEYSFGDIYSREELGLREKEIAVVAALTAIGHAEPQLKVHINGSLNVGCTISELKEVILQMSAYSGFPTCINGMNALKEVLEERKHEGRLDEVGKEPTNRNFECTVEERYESGAEVLSQFDSNQVHVLEEAYGDFAPDLVNLVVCSYADIIMRDNLDKRLREIATIAALTAMGNARPQLKFHINAGLNVGVTIEEVKEIMLLMTVYTGFPSAINGMNVLKEVLEGVPGKLNEK